MKKINDTFKIYGLITLGLVGLVTTSAVANRKRTPMSAGVNGRTLVLKDTLSFSGTGNVDSTAKNEIHFNGRIVADGKVAGGNNYLIDGLGSLAFKINNENPLKYVTIQSANYDIIKFKYRNGTGKTQIDFACQETHINTVTAANYEIVTIDTRGYHEVIMTLSRVDDPKGAAEPVSSMNNFEFYRYQ